MPGSSASPGLRSVTRRRAPRSAVRLPREERTAPAPPRALMLGRVLAGMLAGVCVWFLVALLGEPRFRVDAVTVSGLRQLSEEDVVAVVAAEGRSIFAVQASLIEERLLEEYGCLRQAVVTAALPNRVHVAVVEEDVAIIWKSGERMWWVGEDGRVLGETDDPRGLVVVNDLVGVAPEPATHIVGIPVRLARDLRDALPSNPAYDYVPDLGLVVYVTAEAWPVYLGHDGDAADKAAILRALVERLLSENVRVEYIDLRNERRPMYKPAS